jgi:hypothetical protein
LPAGLGHGITPGGDLAEQFPGSAAGVGERDPVDRAETDLPDPRGRPGADAGDDVEGLGSASRDADDEARLVGIEDHGAGTAGRASEVPEVPDGEADLLWHGTASFRPRIAARPGLTPG